MKYSVIDLFAGAGGLSLGFTQTNKFDIKVAAEINPYASATYLRNHKHTELEEDVCDIDYRKIVDKYGPIDVVIGGPPCQGFSNANRQKNHAISSNNRLVKEYVRAVCELKPTVFVMENVDMLRSETHRFYYSEEDRNIIDMQHIRLRNEKIELLPQDIVLSDADKLISDYYKIQQFQWDEKTYLILNVLFKQKKNLQKFRKAVGKYTRQLKKISAEFMERAGKEEKIKQMDYALAEAISYYLEGSSDSEQQLIEKLEKPIYIQRMISKLKELKENNIIVDEFNTNHGIYAHVQSYGVFDYIKNVLDCELSLERDSDTNIYKIQSAVLNAADFGAPQKRMRFIIIGAKNRGYRDFELPEPVFQSDAYRTVKHAIGDLENIEPVFDVSAPPLEIPDVYLPQDSLAYSLRNTNKLYNHVITQSTETALNRFAALEEGQNFHNLKTEMKEDTYTDVSRTQNTIYLRLKYNEPSGTVVNVRKSMWIHPVINRALSIREAARLQTFPDSFVFIGTKDAQYQQVGNAVPPVLANAIANKVLELLSESDTEC